jgi:hypothetical protein
MQQRATAVFCSLDRSHRKLTMASCNSSLAIFLQLPLQSSSAAAISRDSGAESALSGVESLAKFRAAPVAPGPAI